MDDRLELALVEAEDLVESVAGDLGHHLVGVDHPAALDDKDPLEGLLGQRTEFFLALA